MAKLKQNEITVKKRRDGRWYASTVIGKDKNGKPNRKTSYGRNHEEALERLMTALNEISNTAHSVKGGVSNGK